MGFSIQRLIRRGSRSALERANFAAVIAEKGIAKTINNSTRNYSSFSSSANWVNQVIDAYNNKPMFQKIREFAYLDTHPHESSLRDRLLDLLGDKIAFSKTLLLLAEAQFEKMRINGEKSHDDGDEKKMINFPKLFHAYKKMGQAEGETFKKYVKELVYDQVSYHKLAKGDEEFISKNPMENSVLWNSKIRNMVLEGRFDRAELVFKTMPKRFRNIHTWNIMVYCFSKIDIEKAMSYFNTCPIRSKLSRLCLIDAFVGAGEIDKARGLFQEMEGGGKSDTLACNNMLLGYVYFDRYEKEARQLFEEMEDGRDVVSYDLMMLLYWYNRTAVKEYLNKIPQGESSVTSYNIRLHSLIRREESLIEANSVLKEMFDDAGLVPDKTTLDLAVEVQASGTLDQPPMTCAPESRHLVAKISNLSSLKHLDGYKIEMRLSMK